MATLLDLAGQGTIFTQVLKCLTIYELYNVLNVRNHNIQKMVSTTIDKELWIDLRTKLRLKVDLVRKGHKNKINTTIRNHLKKYIMNKPYMSKNQIIFWRIKNELNAYPSKDGSMFRTVNGFTYDLFVIYQETKSRMLLRRIRRNHKLITTHNPNNSIHHRYSPNLPSIKIGLHEFHRVERIRVNKKDIESMYHLPTPLPSPNKRVRYIQYTSPIDVKVSPLP